MKRRGGGRAAPHARSALPVALVVLSALTVMWAPGATSAHAADPVPSASAAPEDFAAVAEPAPLSRAAQNGDALAPAVGPPTPTPSPSPASPGAAAGPPAGGAPARPLTSPRVRLSGKGNVWRWSFVMRRVLVRARPRRDSAVVMRLRALTPERTQNLVLTLERQLVDGRQWVRVRLPRLPNNSTGWVPREALGGYETVRTRLVVDTRRLRVRLERRGRVVLRARIGVGQRRWPTPRGNYYVRNRLSGFDSPLYGPIAFGTSARSAVLTDWPGGGFIGIHGTDQPQLLPGRVSHGCIRLRNRDILRLARLMPVGTPVKIV